MIGDHKIDWISFELGVAATLIITAIVGMIYASVKLAENKRKRRRARQTARLMASIRADAGMN